MSSILSGAKVSLSINATSGTSGSYKNYEINVEGLPPADSANMAANIMLASSYPAFIFYEDTIADRRSYKYIDVIVKVNEKEYTTRYTPHQLQQVDGCLLTFNGFVRAIKAANADSLGYYSDTSMIDRSATASLAGKLKEAEAQWGAVQKQITKGFRVGERNGGTYVFFKIYLKRETLNQAASFSIDPATKKVIGYSM